MAELIQLLHFFATVAKRSFEACLCLEAEIFFDEFAEAKINENISLITCTVAYIIMFDVQMNLIDLMDL